jgi:hypothetical protein
MNLHCRSGDLLDVLFPKSTGPGPPVPPDTPMTGATFYGEARRPQR